ncbi:hypothetical protein GALMADRAFT_252104 [Galerina marginata CBS 339.88]|uniref:Uncharacterized protein n=1 Tax=Galerina marginata (strain CBS 339.88) TaxID=685588 RepID=A0A067T1C0_GALM3|nr:hypothetical protein GALMADRAFT_252104 [Galerina marginata CBS 339.88]
MASDSSESPMVLTPESTGTGISTSALSIDTSPLSSPTATTETASPAGPKKARRQTAFYPNVNSTNKPQKPFSRSAAKRESVMALGSIEHLQHYFTKTGLSAKKNPLDKPHHGLVLAIGGMGHIPTSPSLSDIQDFQMPPSPAVPNNPIPTFSPHVKAYEVDPESLLPGVIEDVIAVAQAWKLERYADDTSTSTMPPPNLDLPFDVLEVLKTTTRAIRSTRNYLLSLPDESAGTIRAHFRPRSLGRGKHTSTTSNNLSASTSSAPAQPPAPPDPIILIRRSALEVLTVLRQLEENCRLPLSDEAYDAQSDGEHSRGAGTASSPSNGTLELPPDERRQASEPMDPDASITFSLVQVHGRYESVPVWEDEEDAFAVDAEEEREKREGWDERLVLGSGWLYKQDVRLGQLGKERVVVGAYLDIVDEVLFEGKRVPGEERGWDKVRRKREGRAVSRAAKNRRASSGELVEGRGLVGLGAADAEAAAARRRVSTGMVNLMRGMALSEEPDDMDDIKEEEEEETVDDEDLPEWAKRSAFIDDRLGRTHALLASFLPSHLQPFLGPPTSRSDLLASLSSGQLLCVAYNSCVRKSKKPWGFVSKDGVHDIFALEKAAEEQREKQKLNIDEKDKEREGKKMWTFRRTDNLRLWAGALKLRYMIPIQLPSQPVVSSSQQPTALLPVPNSNSSSGSASASANASRAGTPLSSPIAPRFGPRKAGGEPPIQFDARVVAKKEEGWEEMLEAVLDRWVDKVVDERRVFQ